MFVQNVFTIYFSPTIYDNTFIIILFFCDDKILFYNNLIQFFVSFLIQFSSLSETDLVFY